MKALVYTGPKSVEVRSVPDPAPRENAVKVTMIRCGVCGSDIGIFEGRHPRAKAPLILGHEFVGSVADAAGDAAGFALGDRVVAYPLLSCGTCLPCRTGTPHVCRTLGLLGIDVDGGIAEHAWVDADALFKVPDSLSANAAAMIEPLAVAVRSLHQARFQALDAAAVIGAGPIGILTAIVLKRSGASRIVIADMDEHRLDLCRELGFDAVNVRRDNLADHVNGLTGGEGMDIVFECGGTAGAALEMTGLARVGGTICVTGVHKEPHPVNLMDLNFREQRMVGTRVYTKREFELSVTYAASVAADLERLVSHVAPLSGSANVFAMIADPAAHAVKVVVDCQT